MSPTEKCESPDFHTTLDNAFEPTYFLFRRVCQKTILSKQLKKPFTKESLVVDLKVMNS
jgi:hypothetical protein